MGEERVELGKKEVDRPEPGRELAQMGGAAISELVVVDDRPARRRDVLEGIDVIVGAVRPAVDDDERGHK
jgi:hypothetical protein